MKWVFSIFLYIYICYNETRLAVSSSRRLWSNYEYYQKITLFQFVLGTPLDLPPALKHFSRSSIGYNNNNIFYFSVTVAVSCHARRFSWKLRKVFLKKCNIIFFNLKSLMSSPTYYGLDSPGIASRCMRFSLRSRQSHKPNQPPIQRAPSVLLWMKRPNLFSEHPPPSSA